MYAQLNYDIALAIGAIRSDCPYEMYWSTGAYADSKPGVRISAYSDGTAFMKYSSEYVSVYLVTEYKYRSDTSDKFSVNTEETSRATTAAANAKKIVSEADSRSDYGKLKYYLDKVCDLVDYNYAAAAELSKGSSLSDDYDRGAWSLIYVFDDDPSTKVVCEGYAEAYQYLCDITSFDDSKVLAYTVTGNMKGGTGAGSHKWVVVHMSDGNNYLVDPTNCDQGSSGFPYYLFMAGGQTGNATLTKSDGSTVNSFQYTIHNITYTYDSDTMALYTTDELKLAATDYEDEESEQANRIWLCSNSISLGSNISVNYYIVMPAEVHASDGAYMQFRCDGKITKIPVTEGKAYTNKKADVEIPCYLYACPVTASMMTSDIEAALIEADGTKTEFRTYSVEKYANNMLALPGNSSDEKLCTLLKAMLNYGGYSQKYFGKNTNALANRYLTDTDVSAVTADSLADKSYTTSGSIDGITRYGSSLILKSNTEIRHYFEVTDGHSIGEYTFSYGEDGSTSSTTFTPQATTKSGLYYVTIPDVTATNLDQNYVVTVSRKANSSEKLTITYSALSYAKTVLTNDNASAELKNLVRALTLYNQAADSYPQK